MKGIHSCKPASLNCPIARKACASRGEEGRDGHLAVVQPGTYTWRSMGSATQTQRSLEWMWRCGTGHWSTLTPPQHVSEWNAAGLERCKRPGWHHTFRYSGWASWEPFSGAVTAGRWKLSKCGVRGHEGESPSLYMLNGGVNQVWIERCEFHFSQAGRRIAFCVWGFHNSLICIVKRTLLKRNCTPLLR